MKKYLSVLVLGLALVGVVIAKPVKVSGNSYEAVYENLKEAKKAFRTGTKFMVLNYLHRDKGADAKLIPVTDNGLFNDGEKVRISYFFEDVTKNYVSGDANKKATVYHKWYFIEHKGKAVYGLARYVPDGWQITDITKLSETITFNGIDYNTEVIVLGIWKYLKQ
jgi:hypothetical protein